MQHAQAFIAVQVEFCMSQDVSSIGTAAVVDGHQVLLTPLQRALVPPPICAVAAVFHQPVQCVAFGTQEGNEVCFEPAHLPVLVPLSAALSLCLYGLNNLSASHWTT